MIKIGGLGVAGSYLLRRLHDDGFEVAGYDPKRSNYYIPCGYATNDDLLSKYLNNIGIDTERYILSTSEKVTFSGNNFNEISFGSKGLCTIDKNALEKDMISGYPNFRDRIGKTNDGMIIDATGITRAYLGPAVNDYSMYAKEYLTKEASHNDFYFYFFENGRGYFWEFPLGDKFHVGAGSDSLELIDKNLSRYSRELMTGRRIRLVPLFDQMFKDNIVGVGEAIGTVSPISGEGIMPSIKSAEMLFQAVKKNQDVEKMKEEYEFSIKREFKRYERIFSLVRNVQSGKIVNKDNLKAVIDVKRDLIDFGIDFKLRKVVGHFL